MNQWPKLISFTAKLSAYYPGPYASEEEAALEGGNLDRAGEPLHTLQEHIAGIAPYCSVAADRDAFRYGQLLCIPDLNRRYGFPLEFRVVDTGGAFKGKGRTRLDICVKDQQASYDKMLNSELVIVALIESQQGGPA